MVALRERMQGLFEGWQDDLPAGSGWQGRTERISACFDALAGAVTPLLHAWLEDDRADAVAAAVKASPIRKDIRSGYDIRLLADLVEGGTAPEDIPGTRMGLYEAMLARAKQPDGSDYPLAELCRVTWDAWAAGERQFVPGDTIPLALLEPLLAPGVCIVRPVHDGRFEFRHDQMRG